MALSAIVQVAHECERNPVRGSWSYRQLIWTCNGLGLGSAAQLALFSLTLRNSRPVLAAVFRASHTTVTAGGALGSSLLCCPPVKLVLGYFCFRF